jgi:hypothetical protein
MTKYMDDYNYHDWSKFMVREPKDKPTKPHFAGVLFDKHYESSGYDTRDSNYGSYAVPNVIYFAFPDQETLKQWALRASKDKKEFFCFEVKKLATVELVVNVDLEFK